MSARKVNQVTAEELKKPDEPTLESRVSGLEYRASHPNKQTLAELLITEEGARAFAGAVDRCLAEKNLVSWEDTLERNWPEANRALEADKAPLARPIIWGALLGAALSLAVLAICNPAAFHRPSTAAGLTTHAIVVGESTRIKADPSAPLLTGQMRSSDESFRFATDDLASLGTDAATVYLSVDRECWISVVDEKGRTWVNRHVDAGYHISFRSRVAFPVTIRSGCPGSIYYSVDGIPAHPDNLSKKPEQSEVVRLP